MYDAIIVGARCAGASTAMLLSRKGHRVLLVDRSTFPSDMRLSNHLVWPPGIANLKRWGLLDQLARTGCPPMAQATMDLGSFSLTGRFDAVDGVREAYAPRRKVLDSILVEAATAAGAELWDGCTLDQLITDDGSRVRGIRGHGRGGRSFSATGTVVIGADGMRSPVASMVQAPTYDARPARQRTYFTYWSGVLATEPTLYSRPHRSVVAFPTNDDLTCVSVSWAIDAFPDVRGDIAGNYFHAIREASPELDALVQAGTREERWVGTAVPSYLRRPYGPGWALVGDAGYLKDPCTAQGITDAFHHAELLADAIDDGLRGRRPLDAALADYERQRNEAVMPMYEFTYARSGLEPPTPQMQELIGALRNDQQLTDRFIGVFTGTVPVQDFFGAPQGAAA